MDYLMNLAPSAQLTLLLVVLSIIGIWLVPAPDHTLGSKGLTVQQKVMASVGQLLVGLVLVWIVQSLHTSGQDTLSWVVALLPILSGLGLSFGLSLGFQAKSLACCGSA